MVQEIISKLASKQSTTNPNHLTGQYSEAHQSARNRQAQVFLYITKEC